MAEFDIESDIQDRRHSRLLMLANGSFTKSSTQSRMQMAVDLPSVLDSTLKPKWAADAHNSTNRPG